MDFNNRGVRGQTVGNQIDQSNSGPVNSNGPSKRTGRFSKNSMPWNRLGKIGNMSFLLLLTIIVAGAIFSLVNFNGTSNESRFVDNGKYQAVFLNGGQVYFGKISELNSKFIRVYSVYYLRVNQQVQPNAATSQNNDISLVKLGCELHGPQDEMVINREQIIFWENLKDDGQVAKAVEQYKQQYPNGQNCSDQAASGQQSNADVNSGTATTPAPATTPTTKATTPTTDR